MLEHKVTIEAVVPFFDYGDESKNRKVRKNIEACIISYLISNLSFITLLVDKNNKGGYIEDSSREVTYTIVNPEENEKNPTT